MAQEINGEREMAAGATRPLDSTQLKRDLLLLVLACAALWGWTYGLWDLWGPDEPRYVQIARELLERTNWLILTILGKSYDQKPPLPYWMMGGMLKLNGGVVTTWAVRLPSVLFGTMTVLITYLVGRRLGRRTGWLAAWVLLTAPLFMMEVPTARLDILFTGWIALAMGAWLGGGYTEKPLPVWRTILFWVGVTGAFFIKGPVVWLIVLMPAVLESIWTRRWRPLGRLRPQWGVPVMVALIAGWIVAQGMLVSWDFVLAQFKTATVERVNSPTMHPHGPHYYFVSIFGDGFMPWSPMLVLALVALWRGRRQPAADWPRVRPIMIWALWAFLFFSIVPTKREQYLLPIYPALAILTAWYLTRVEEGGTVPRWARRLGLGLTLAAGVALAAGAAALLAGIQPFGAKHAEMRDQLALVRGARFFTARMAGIGCYGLLLAGLAWCWPRMTNPKRATALLMGTVFLGGIVGLGVGNPLMNPLKSTRPVNEVVQRLVQTPQERVGALGTTYKAQYKVYSTYLLLDLTSSALFSPEPKLPRILIGETAGSNDKAKVAKQEQALKNLGYERVYRTPALEGLSVYLKR